MAMNGTISGAPDEADVWSFSGRKYRRRAIALLLVNVLLFCGVGVFAYWIRSGVVFALTTDGYAEQILGAFRFGARTSATLGSLLLEPISVLRVEMQIWVLGLLMATLISIPILVSILYRFWCSLPFIAIVGFIAVMPWLALTLLGSCLIASVKPFRSKYHFMSALFALVPTVVYLILAWADSRESFASDYDPVDGIKFIAPWVLAIVAAGAVFAVVLSIAKLADYRAGTITPLLTLMFALPVILFEQYVGRDELSYRLLLAMDRDYFADVDASLGLRQAVKAAQLQNPIGGDLRDVEELAEQRWLFGLSGNIDESMHSVLTRHQWDIAERCDQFLADFPSSVHAGAVLFLKARALDRRIDAREFRETNWIRCFSDFPSPASRSTWQLLTQNQREGPLGACAELSLARMDLRSGNVDRALQRLRGAEALLAESEPPGLMALRLPGRHSLPGAAPRLLRSMESDLGISWTRTHVAVQHLIDLLQANADPVYGYDPITGPRQSSANGIRGLVHFNPRDKHYPANLLRLKEAYPRCQLMDNIEVEMAMATPDLKERMAKLEQLLAMNGQGDAAAEALYRLAETQRQASSGTAAAETTARLIHEFGNTIWAAQARRGPAPVGILAATEPK